MPNVSATVLRALLSTALFLVPCVGRAEPIVDYFVRAPSERPGAVATQDKFTRGLAIDHVRPGFVGNAEPSFAFAHEHLGIPHDFMDASLSLRASLALVVPPFPSVGASAHARPTPLTLRPRLLPALDRVGIGRTIHRSGGRRVILDLTPSPRHCAPLVEFTF